MEVLSLNPDVDMENYNKTKKTIYKHIFGDKIK